MQVVESHYLKGLIEASTIISQVSQNSCYRHIEEEEQVAYYFYCLKLPDYSGFESDKLQYLSNSDYKMINKMFAMGKELKTDSIIKFDRVLISYPFACFFHQPIQCTLADFLHQKQSSLTYSQKLNIQIQLAEAIKAIHDKRICHRKIHLETFLREKENRFILADFSQSVSLGNAQQQNDPVTGLTKFSAPELKKQKKHDLASDIWSLGAVFYYVLFGSLDGINIGSEDTEVSLPENYPVWMKNFYVKMLHASPSQRYNINDVLVMLKSAQKCKAITSKILSNSS